MVEACCGDIHTVIALLFLQSCWSWLGNLGAPGTISFKDFVGVDCDELVLPKTLQAPFLNVAPHCYVFFFEVSDSQRDAAFPLLAALGGAAAVAGALDWLGRWFVLFYAG
jgi:hypothetical protein